MQATDVIGEEYEVFKYDTFAKLSLLTKVEVIQAIVKVKAECNKVAAMSLYHIPTTKHMRLEEFEHIQGQASAQVCTLTRVETTHNNVMMKCFWVQDLLEFVSLIVPSILRSR